MLEGRNVTGGCPDLARADYFCSFQPGGLVADETGAVHFAMLPATDIDFALFSGHKLYGLTGIGGAAWQNPNCWKDVVLLGGKMVYGRGFHIYDLICAVKLEAGTLNAAGNRIGRRWNGWIDYDIESRPKAGAEPATLAEAKRF